MIDDDDDDDDDDDYDYDDDPMIDDEIMIISHFIFPMLKQVIYHELSS